MKIILWMSISLNGIIATPDNKEDFLSNENWTEFVKAVKKRGCLIWGRKTYDVVRTWDKSYLKPFKNIVKVILSSNPNLTLDKGFIQAMSPQEAINLLKGMGYKEVILTGGARNNSAFAKLKLIDEIFVDLEGVVIGNGIPLFAPEDFRLKLKLLEINKVTKNIIQLHYQIVK